MPGLNPDTDILEDAATGVIGKADILETDRDGPTLPAGRRVHCAQPRFSRLAKQPLQLLDERCALPDIPEPVYQLTAESLLIPGFICLA